MLLRRKEQEKRLIKGKLKVKNHAYFDSLSYSDYLKTGYWWIIRKKVLQRDKNTCTYCRFFSEGNGAGLQVHHIKYRGRAKEKMTDLITLCERCHKQVHNIREDERVIMPIAAFAV